MLLHWSCIPFNHGFSHIVICVVPCARNLQTNKDGGDEVHSSWYLTTVELLNKSTGIKSAFNYNNWVAPHDGGTTLKEASSVQVGPCDGCPLLIVYPSCMHHHQLYRVCRVPGFVRPLHLSVCKESSTRFG